MNYRRVRMVCEDVKDVPAFELPPPYVFRWYQPGDERAWVDIQKRADRYNVITTELYERQFGNARADLSRRQLFLCDADTAVGTVTAWFAEPGHGRAYGNEYGRVHWVAIVPEYQGRGLAKPLMSTVCKRLCDLGNTKAFLTTATVRVPAINLYFSCAFRPDIHTPQDRPAWQELLRTEGQEPYTPELLAWLRHALA